MQPHALYRIDEAGVRDDDANLRTPQRLVARFDQRFAPGGGALDIDDEGVRQARTAAVATPTVRARRSS